MNVHIHVDSMKEAEHLSAICKEYPYELYLRSEKFCIDPKSTLGILAMMYSARDCMYLDTGDLEAVRAHLKPNTVAVYLETPANPTLKLADISTPKKWST